MGKIIPELIVLESLPSMDKVQIKIEITTDVSTDHLILAAAHGAKQYYYTNNDPQTKTF